MIFCLDTHKLDILQSFKKCYIVIYTKRNRMSLDIRFLLVYRIAFTLPGDIYLSNQTIFVNIQEPANESNLFLSFFCCIVI